MPIDHYSSRNVSWYHRSKNGTAENHPGVHEMDLKTGSSIYRRRLTGFVPLMERVRWSNETIELISRSICRDLKGNSPDPFRKWNGSGSLGVE